MIKMERREKAMAIALESMDIILEVENKGDYFMIIGKLGEDVLTYRVYDNGFVCKKNLGN